MDTPDPSKEEDTSTSSSLDELDSSFLIYNLPRCNSPTLSMPAYVDEPEKIQDIEFECSRDQFPSTGIGLNLNIENIESIINDMQPSCATKIAAEGGNYEEFYQPRPMKIKMKEHITTSSDGGRECKCSCKKSACIKLYCECLAAGCFCAEPCSCQGCLNRPEYEDLIQHVRKKIKSRDPLAFAPRVVQQDIPSHNMDDVNAKKQSSAMHKRGCKCKKSMCTKKYCECYQVNVGCFSGCGCEGCENPYGKRQDAPLCDLHGFSTQIPSLQSSDRLKLGRKDWQSSTTCNAVRQVASLSNNPNPASMTGTSWNGSGSPTPPMTMTMTMTMAMAMAATPTQFTGYRLLETDTRKFILKDVPSCIDPKDNGDQQDSSDNASE